MRVMAIPVVFLSSISLAVAQNVPPQYLNVTNTDGSLESAWVESHPGPSDYWNSRFDGLSGRPIAGVAAGSADLGVDWVYPRAGLYDANWTLDPTGNTPDLSSGFTAGPVPGGDVVFNYVFGSFGGSVVPVLEPQHVVCQSPPDGLMGIGNDDDTTTVFAGWTNNGYTPPAHGRYNWGLNPVVDAIAELKALPGGCHSYLHQYLSWTDETGDFTSLTRRLGQFYGLLYHTSCLGARWQVWLSSLGTPITKLTGKLFAIPSGGGGYLRAGDFLPCGFGGFTYSFVGVGGVPGVQGTVHISNEVTLILLPDPVSPWGIKDDGSIETGWVVSIPSGSSDYFSNWFYCCQTPFYVTDFWVAVLDFGTTATSFPMSGVFAANHTLDPSGWTPDLSQGWGVQPFTFVPLTFATTSGMYVTNDFPDIPYATFGTDDVHGVIQFPPGDSGWLGVGGDTTLTPAVCWGSTWTINGYTTPANRFDGTAGWGIRLGSY
ncbi:MAG: hypothetical protein AB1486_18330 [Planctomycetota bacterium]